MTDQIMGYAARVVGEDLTPLQYEPPKLGSRDVRVAVTHCGVCHTDLQAIDDYYGITSFPFVPGHEIVGFVTEAGSEVSALKVGDRVGIGWQARSCGKCEWCLKGETQLCMAIEDTTVMVPYGGFSTSVIADHRFVYPLPASLPSEVAAVLMCAGVTVYAALKNQQACVGMKIGVLGLGGVGHMAVQFARAMGCQVDVLSSSPDKKEQALAFGASRFIDCTDRKCLRQVQYNYDLVFSTVNCGELWSPIFATLKKRGTLVLLGFPEMEFNSTNIVAHELSITGSLVGRPALMREMLVFAQEHAIQPVVELMPMSQVNAALQKVKENKARYRIVLVNDGIV